VGFARSIRRPEPTYRDLHEAGHRGDRRLELVRRDRKELRLQLVQLLQLLVARLDLPLGLIELPHPVLQIDGRPRHALLQAVVELVDRAVRGLKLADALAELLPQPAPLDPARDGGAQVLDIGRLEHVVVGALAEGIHGRLERGVAGEDDAHGVRRPPPGRGQDVHPVEIVQVQVGEDEVEDLFLDLLERGRTGERRRDAIPVHLEDRRHRDGDAFLVVDDQEPRWHRPMVLRSAASG